MGYGIENSHGIHDVTVPKRTKKITRSVQNGV